MVFSWFRRKPAAAPQAPAAKAVAVDSGCTGVCELDMVSQLCKGCMRTVSEIGNWRHMSTEQKITVNEAASARKAGQAKS